MQRQPLLLLALAAAQLLIANAQCPSGWTLFVDSDGAEGFNSCLQVFTSPTRNQAQSRANCVSIGGHLLTIKSTNDNANNLLYLAALSAARSK